MSGIAGIIHFDGKPVEPGLIEKMTGAMAHRGPDGINHWVKGSVALGQCMLRTTPESLEEHQPLTNEDESLVLVMDGRVDNWEALREDLLRRGARLRTRADAELVLRAYELWGAECPDRIIGEFVFIVWDARKRGLFAARDVAGTRLFHYFAEKSSLAFSSEIRGLIALERIEPRLNESRLLDYLVVPFDRDDESGTFYQNVHRLPAGHALWIDESGTRTWRYWDPTTSQMVRPASVDDCVQGFLEQLRISVRCRLRSIAPVGAMLSGGLDSSSIVGLIRKECKADLRWPLRTYSLVRQDRENCPDWNGIREMLRDGWIEPMVISSATAGNVCRSYLEGIKDLDEPFALSQGFTDAIVFEAAASRGCGVILDGMASDLLFYSPEHSLQVAFRNKLFSKIPAILSSHRQHGIEVGLGTFPMMLLRTFAPESLRAMYRSLRAKREARGFAANEVPGNLINMIHKEIASQYLTDKLAQREQTRRRLRSEDDCRSHARLFTSGAISFAHEVDGQIALSKGVEPRSPFSDRRLIEYAIQMPLEAKLSTLWYKYTLRGSMEGILPDGVRWRRNRMGHPGPAFFQSFISEVACTMPRVWSLPDLTETMARWIDSSRLGCAWKDYHRNGVFAVGFNLFTLVVLAQWLSTHPVSYSD